MDKEEARDLYSVSPALCAVTYLTACVSGTHIRRDPNPESCAHLISLQFLLLTQDAVTRIKPHKNQYAMD